MEYLIFLLALLAAGLFIFLKGLWDARKMELWQRKKLKEAFGTRAKREYKDGEFHGISGYFRTHESDFYIDDITWNDLNMDEIFMQMNATGSSAGQEYLYYMLRTPVFREEELLEREQLISWFKQHEEERLNIQMLCHQLGRTGKYSIYDYLDFLGTLGKRSSVLIVVTDVLIVLAAVLIGMNVQVGLIGLIGLLAFNVAAYMKEKQKIEPYLICFKYIFRTLNIADKLCKIKCSAITQTQQTIRGLLPAFTSMRRSAAWGMQGNGDGGNPLDLLLAYLNMVFHFDILMFNRMLHQVQKLTGQIDILQTQIGRIDALIAVSGYRESLPGYCRPQFGSRLQMKNVYHPLLSEPVKNDLSVQKGILLTGSNASGKSTFLKAAAINALFAQTIHTCCADDYHTNFFRVMSSMALRDDLSSGESYYIVEIKSLKRILQAADEEGAPILCFVDEVLRGTNTVERIAASTQILKSLCRENVCCFAATHDIELTELLQKEYENYHFEEEILENDIHFPYKLMPQKASGRNAIKLLSIMGYSDEIVKNAEKMAAVFVQSGVWNS